MLIHAKDCNDKIFAFKRKCNGKVLRISWTQKALQEGNGIESV